MLNEYLRAQGQTGLARLLSLRQELPTNWYQFLNPPSAEGIQTLTLPLGPERFPFIFSNRTLAIGTLEFFLKVKPEFASTHNDSTIKLTVAAGNTAPTPENAQPEDVVALAAWEGTLRGAQAFDDPPGVWTMNAWLDAGEAQRIDAAALDDVIVILSLHHRQLIARRGREPGWAADQSRLTKGKAGQSSGGQSTVANE